MPSLQLSIQMESLPKLIDIGDRLLLLGSCFTDHMAKHFEQCKLAVDCNPHGILFNPYSIVNALSDYIEGRVYDTNALYYQDELYHSWQHHSDFSGTKPGPVIHHINDTIQTIHHSLPQYDWYIITLGSAFYYQLADGTIVANNHKAPGQMFTKHLAGIADMITIFENSLQRIWTINPNAQFLFTVSPVRHAREGVVNNNRSKARLLETVHTLCERHAQVHYFPAYELVIDVLRDYRFFDVDMIHPNYLATQCVWEKAKDTLLSKDCQYLYDQYQKISNAMRHKPRYPQTEAHGQFLKAHLKHVEMLENQFPNISFASEIAYFKKALKAWETLMQSQ